MQASTPEVYGNTSGVIREDAPFNPSTPYAISKAACDMNLLAFHKAYGFPVAFTRAANVCGPGQALYRIIPKTILCMLTGRKLRLEGGGTSVRSFIHIRDVVDATLRICRDGTPGGIYHLSTDQRESIRRWSRRSAGSWMPVSRIAWRLPRPGWGKTRPTFWIAPRPAPSWAGSPADVQDAIRDTAAWMKKNLDRLRDLPDQYVHKE